MALAGPGAIVGQLSTVTKRKIEGEIFSLPPKDEAGSLPKAASARKTNNISCKQTATFCISGIPRVGKFIFLHGTLRGRLSP